MPPPDYPYLPISTLITPLRPQHSLSLQLEPFARTLAREAPELSRTNLDQACAQKRLAIDIPYEALEPKRILLCPAFYYPPSCHHHLLYPQHKRTPDFPENGEEIEFSQRI
jgi:hypothetical protein